MKHGWLTSTAVAFAVAACAYVSLRSQEPPAALTLANQAADALGGRDRIMAIRTLTMIGYGEMIDGFGLGNISASPYAPMKLNNLLEFERTFDVANQRMRTKVRRRTNFTFANAGQNLGTQRVNEVIDGQRAYNVNANGNANPVGGGNAIERRYRMFSHPVMAIRVALDPATRLSNLRREGNTSVVDVTTAQNDEFTLGIDPDTKLPSWIRWMIPQQNFGELTYQVHFVAYSPVAGVQLPMGYTTMMDFRNIAQESLYIDRNIVNGPIEDMQMPAANAANQAGGQGGGRAGGPGGAPQTPVQLADGVWRLGNTHVIEFADHLKAYEIQGNDAAVVARIQQINKMVPGKPLTHVIVSHHHDDHAIGLRAIVSQGVTVVAHYSIEGMFRELTERRTTRYHDTLSRNWQPMKFLGVKDHIKFKDARNELDVYHVINNNHMATAVFAHVPAARLMIEADLTTRGWDYQWWGGSLMDNIENYKLQVDRVSPVHGQIEPLGDVVKEIERQVQGARDLCEKTSASGFYKPGCPVQYTREARAQ